MHDTVLPYLHAQLEKLAYHALWPIVEARYIALSTYLRSQDVVLAYDPIFTVNGWLDLLANYIVASFWVIALALYLLLAGARIVANIASGRDNFFTNYAYFDDWEEELGSLDDATYYGLLFGLVVIWFYYFTLVSSYIILNNLSWIIAIFTIILTSGILVPAAVLKHMGIHFVQYVRGSGRSTSLVFETVLDFVSVSVIMIRFFIQNIRFLFIFFAFFELYEYAFDKLDVIFAHTLGSAVTWEGFWGGHYTGWYVHELFSQILIQWFTYLYYLGHLTLLFIVQLSIYFVLSFWLFFFLYTTFLLQPHEKYFFYKRNLRQ